jgi:hypothetical protein
MFSKRHKLTCRCIMANLPREGHAAGCQPQSAQPRKKHDWQLYASQKPGAEALQLSDSGKAGTDKLVCPLLVPAAAAASAAPHQRLPCMLLAARALSPALPARSNVVVH